MRRGQALRSAPPGSGNSARCTLLGFPGRLRMCAQTSSVVKVSSGAEQAHQRVGQPVQRRLRAAPRALECGAAVYSRSLSTSK